MKRLVIIPIALVLVSLQTLAQDSEWMNYDDIVNELSAVQTEKKNETPYIDPFNLLKFHFGVSYANTIFRYSKLSQSKTAAHSGIQLLLGIDLFSEYWAAEIGYVNYGRKPHFGEDVALRQFDLKVAFRSALVGPLGMKIASGLSTRQINSTRYVDSFQGGQIITTEVKDKSSSPDFTISFGLTAKLLNHMSVNADLAYRTALTSDAPYRSGVDILVGLSGHL